MGALKLQLAKEANEGQGGQRGYMQHGTGTGTNTGTDSSRSGSAAGADGTPTETADADADTHTGGGGALVPGRASSAAVSPLLVVGGTDGSGTRRVVQLLADLGVVMVSEDPGTFDIHGAVMKGGWPPVIKPVLEAAGGNIGYDAALLPPPLVASTSQLLTKLLVKVIQQYTQRMSIKDTPRDNPSSNPLSHSFYLRGKGGGGQHQAPRAAAGAGRGTQAPPRRDRSGCEVRP